MGLDADGSAKFLEISDACMVQALSCNEWGKKPGRPSVADNPWAT
jgi:hypothetical protein